MTVGIVGVGLIGGSIGMACKANGHRVIGYDSDSEHLEKGISRHCLDEAAELQEVAGADAVFVAVPPAVVQPTLAAMIPHLGAETAVSDCTSVKSSLVAWAAKGDAELARRFVPGHPMAGHEKSGPAYASAWMFRGARWILTPMKATSADAKDRIVCLVKEMGATPVRISPDEHDRTVAVLSHLPHILATALLEMGETVESPEVGAGSWRDLTRVGGVDPELWSQILYANADHAAHAINDLMSRLASLREELWEPERMKKRIATAGEMKARQQKAGASGVAEKAAPARRGRRP